MVLLYYETDSISSHLSRGWTVNHGLCCSDNQSVGFQGFTESAFGKEIENYAPICDLSYEMQYDDEKFFAKFSNVQKINWILLRVQFVLYFISPSRAQSSKNRLAKKELLTEGLLKRPDHSD